MKKHQWILALCMAVLLTAACFSMPVLAEKMIADDVDKVITEGETTTAGSDDIPEDIQQKRAEKVARDTLVEGELPFEPVSENARKVMVENARKAYRDVFGTDIPEGYYALDSFASEEDGMMMAACSLVPPNWEQSTSTLPMPESDTTYTWYYSFTFGNVDPETGDGDVMGMQRFQLSWNDQEIADVQYTQAQKDAMEAKAREFAKGLGMEPGEVVAYDKVTGSFEPGLVVIFDRGDGKTLSVTVSELGEVSGYSLIRAKG